MPEIVRWSEARDAGLKRYFTGRPCARGHIDERYTIGHKCVECSRLRYQADTARFRGWILKYAEKNREKLASKEKSRRDAIQDLLNVLRVEMPELLKEFGL